jgi:hypothetical protein
MDGANFEDNFESDNLLRLQVNTATPVTITITNPRTYAGSFGTESSFLIFYDDVLVFYSYIRGQPE